MKKFTSLALAAVMTVSAVASLAMFTACGGGDNSSSSGSSSSSDGSAKNVKIGMICIGDENETYDANFLNGLKSACAKTGATYSTQVNIREDEAAYTAAKDFANDGCDIVFADSYGHGDHMKRAASEFKDVEFCHATGDMALTAGIDNFHNAFASIYEGRYLAGVVAGTKLKEMVDTDTLPATATKGEDGALKIGYVGAFDYAEVISGYTSFYLGVKSVYSNVTMEVKYTNSWGDETKEQTAANALIDGGCALISQHADTYGAPRACETKGVPNVSYNLSTASVAKNTYLVASSIDWEPYFEYIIGQVAEGKKIDTDWTGTVATGSVTLKEYGTSVSDAAKANVATAKKALQDGSLKVFDCSKFTVTKNATRNQYADVTMDANGHVTSYNANVIPDEAYAGDTEVVKMQLATVSSVTYIAESEFRSAPYFGLLIDGINII